MTPKYFHKLTDEEYLELANGNTTIRQLLDNYKQPDWCGYPEALNPFLGCDYLTDRFLRSEISRGFCQHCPCYERN